MKGMNVDDVENCETMLTTGATGLDDLVTAVSGLQGPLQDCWTGADSDACVEFVNNLTNQMTDMSVEVMKIHDWVDKTRQNYVEAAANGAKYYAQ